MRQASLAGNRTESTRSRPNASRPVGYGRNVSSNAIGYSPDRYQISDIDDERAGYSGNISSFADVVFHYVRPARLALIAHSQRAPVVVWALSELTRHASLRPSTATGHVFGSAQRS